MSWKPCEDCGHLLPDVVDGKTCGEWEDNYFKEVDEKKTGPFAAELSNLKRDCQMRVQSNVLLRALGTAEKRREKKDAEVPTV